MYYLAKIAQAAGLTIIIVNFITYFPKLLNFKIFLTGGILFLFGWIVQRFLLKS